MFPLTLILPAAAALDRVDAERAAERIRQAQYYGDVERRAQHREIEHFEPMATVDVKCARRFSDEERDQLRQALDRLTRCAAGKRVNDHATGFYVPEQKAGWR